MEVHLAYLDPGSGSIIWQAIIGGVLGGAYVLRSTASRLVHSARATLNGLGSSHQRNRKGDGDSKS